MSSSTAPTPPSKPEHTKRPQPTHFLCLPLYPQSTAIFSTPPPSTTTLLQPSPAHNILKLSLRQLLKDEGEPDEASQIPDYEVRIPRGAFRPFGTLHLTLGVMSLKSSEEITKAVSVLNNIDLQSLLNTAFSQDDSGGGGNGGGVKLNPEETNNNKLLLSLKGLRSMQTPKKTTVLYAHPILHPPSSDEKFDPLYTFASTLRERFITEGLIQAEDRKFTLHATVVNTIYSKSHSSKGSSSNKHGRGRGGGRGRGKEKLIIDASDIIDKYADTVFVEGLEIDRVELCKMGARKGEEVVGDDGEVEVRGAGYEVVAWKRL